jgi:hypothetical protein
LISQRIVSQRGGGDEHIIGRQRCKVGKTLLVGDVQPEPLKAVWQEMRLAADCGDPPALLDQRQAHSCPDISATENKEMHGFTALFKNG